MRIPFIFSCLLVAALFGCKKKGPELTYPIWSVLDSVDFRANALRNGEEWAAEAEAYYHYDGLTGEEDSSIVRFDFVTYNYPNGAFKQVREGMSIYYLPKKVGLYPITSAYDPFGASYPTARFEVHVEHGDTGGFPGYLSREGDMHSIEILSVDEAKKEIKGRFEVHFLFFASGEPYYDLPDKVSFTNATFTAKILD